MKLTNENYCCTVIRIRGLLPLEGLDNLLAVPIFGFQALVNKSYNTEDLYLLFTAESQLNEEFCKQNNLFSNSSLNVDPEAKGYLGDKRRIRAIKLRGHVSNALILPVSSLSYLGINNLKEGDAFNEIGGCILATKYEARIRSPRKAQKKRAFKKASLLNQKSIPEHIDTSHWGRNKHKVHEDEHIIVEQKIHGCAFRGAHQLVRTYPKWALKILDKIYKHGFGNYRIVKFFEKLVGQNKWRQVAGSRRVIKLVDLDQSHYYDLDIWNQALEKIAHLIPKNWVIYGELIGWVGHKPIQPKYTYDLPVGEHALYVYRIAIVNEDGYSVDLSYDQMVEWCSHNGLKTCPLIWRGPKSWFNEQDFMDIDYVRSGYTQCVPLSKDSPCDEGVVIRVDGLQPALYKAKSPIFLGHETKQLDDEVITLEDLESEGQDDKA